MTSSGRSPGAASPNRVGALLGDPRTARGILATGLLLYAAGFLAFSPRVVSVRDEVAYIRQAAAFAAGEATVVEKEALSGQTRRVPASTYPPGTSALQAPFVSLGGWRWAALASLLCLAVTVLLLAGWLRREGRSPLFALLVLGYPPALALSRLAMSDLPSAAVVTLGLSLFWRGQDGPGAWWLASGFTAGLSLLFRETNALLFAPLFTGALLRRERKALALMAGVAAAVPLRLLSSALLFASPFFHRPPAGFRWGPSRRTRHSTCSPCW